MSDLEARYRTVLYWYPSTWREQNADVVVGTLMDEADAEGRSRPRPTEMASLAVHGLRARLGEPVDRPARDRAALLALAMAVALSLLGFVGGEWAPFAHPAIFDNRVMASGIHIPFGPFKSPGAIVYLAIIAAGVLSMVRRPVLAKTFLVFALAVSALIAVAAHFPRIAQISTTTDRPQTPELIVLSLLVLVALAGRPSRVPRNLMLAAIATGVALAGAVALSWHDWVRTGSGIPGWGGPADGLDNYLPPTVRWNDVYLAVIWLGALLLLAIIMLVRRSGVWAAASVIAALPWLVALVLPAVAAHFEPVTVFMLIALGLLLAIIVRVSGYRLHIARRS